MKSAALIVDGIIINLDKKMTAPLKKETFSNSLLK